MAGLRVIARGQYPCKNHFIIGVASLPRPLAK